MLISDVLVKILYILLSHSTFPPQESSSSPASRRHINSKIVAKTVTRVGSIEKIP